MKKSFFLFTALLLCIFLIGCSPLELLLGPSGSIEVDTYPSGAKIFLDDKDIGYTTPYTITNLLKGTYEIKVTLDEKSYTETVIVYSNLTSNIYKNFSPPQLIKINALPPYLSIILSLGNTTSIISVTAYYDDYSNVNIPLSECTYSSDNKYATVNSYGIITGNSAGTSTIAVSYTEGEITKTNLVFVDIRDNPTGHVEPEPPEETGNVVITLDNWEQKEWGSVYAYYTIKNNSNKTVNDYEIYFKVICTDNSIYYDSCYEEYILFPSKTHSDKALVGTYDKQANSLQITELLVDIFY